MKKLICLLKGHDYEFSFTPGVMGDVDAVEWKCSCNRCGKTYTKVQHLSSIRDKSAKKLCEKQMEEWQITEISIGDILRELVHNRTITMLEYLEIYNLSDEEKPQAINNILIKKGKL